jgi:hypothetical protein
MQNHGSLSMRSPARRSPHDRRRLPRLLAAAAVLLALLAPALLTPGATEAQGSDGWIRWSPPRTVYIPETGQSIDGYFLDTWRSWGAGSLGYPVTPEITENGRIVQYYQYGRMEYWPEDPTNNYVQFGAIGRELRPLPLIRQASPSESASDEVAVSKELARELRAWLPLTGNVASKPNTATWRYIPETQHTVQSPIKDFWEATGDVSYHGNPLTEAYTKNGVTYQVFEYSQLAWTADRGVWEVPLGEVLATRYRLPTHPSPQGDLPIYSENLFIPPPPPPNGERFLDINLTTQYMVAVQGNVVVAETYVSTGKPGFDTPPGTYYVNTKLPSQTMSGVLGGEYYNVPDVPWVMYFTNRGHAIHGAYWHNNFGAVMSHGCVNLPLDVAEFIYNWASVGTRVDIHW